METLSTREVCRRLELTEPGLRHALRRPGAPRPQVHPSARIFLWREEDVRRLEEFLQGKGDGLPAQSRRPTGEEQRGRP